MKKVKHTLDTLPPLTKAQEDNLKRLATMPDEEINYDDIPKLTEAQLAGMQRGAFYRPVKKQRGCRCAGMAQVAGQGLPVSHERNPTGRHAEYEITKRPPHIAGRAWVIRGPAAQK